MRDRRRFAYILGIVLSLAVISLSGCGGADAPFSLVDKNPNGPGGGSGSPGGPGGSGGQGCTVQFSSQLVLRTQVEPGSSDSADPAGLIISEPKEIPPITLRLSGSQVTLNGDDFQPAEILLGTQNVTVRQKAGNVATGTYNAAEGSFSISGVEFEITSPLEIALPSFTLTTESTGTVVGDHGNLTAQGERLDSSTRRIKVVGGFKIESFPLSEFVGAAVTVTFDGELNQIPDPATCTGGAASGVTFKEIVTDSEGEETEASLGSNNTLNFDSVFVPQAGVDSPAVGDTRFYKKKILRVKNQTSQAIGGTIGNLPGYLVSPSGAVNIAPGASQDFQITFGFAPASDYSESSVPPTRTVSAALTFGSATANLAGIAKRAGPELSVVGTEPNALSTIDLGVIPAPVLGMGTSATLDCRPTDDRRVPIITQKLTLLNTGIRPLEILHINKPTDHVAQSADPFCPSYGSEFVRMSLGREGSATCQTVTQNGMTFLTDHCQIPPDGSGKVSFKVVYLPINASPVKNATGTTLEKDSGTLTIESNDPRFNESDFALNLEAALSADQSDVLKIKKEGSSVEVANEGNVRINIPNTSDTTVTQKLILLNRLDEPLNNVQISVEDTAHFQILSDPTPPPTTIPAQQAGVGTGPGQAEFYVRFTKPGGMSAGAVNSRLRVRFTPNGGSENVFEVNLSGTVNYQVITGETQVTIDFLTSYFDTALLRNSPVDSEDFRNPGLAFLKPGTLRLNFQPVEGSEGQRTVTVNNLPGIEPTNPNLLANLKSLNLTDRRKLLGVYSTRLTGYPGGVEDGNHDGIPDCTLPESIQGDYVAGKCSLFYYVFATKPGLPGIYNDETGSLVFPDINLQLLNPYHNTVIDYISSLSTNTDLKATISTLNVDSKFAGDVPLVPEPSISASQIAVPDADAQAILTNPSYQCPDGWNPMSPETPTFSCFMRPSSPHFVQGLNLTPLPNGDYRMVLTLLTRFGPVGPPDNVPSFMANGRLWVALLGTLRPCNVNTCEP